MITTDEFNSLPMEDRIRYAQQNKTVPSNADLSRANLSGTCIDKKTNDLARMVVQTCTAWSKKGKHAGIIVYRTATSVHIGNQEYEPGNTYNANALSWSTETDCHVGIYACMTEKDARIHGEWRALIRCFVRHGDWVPVPGKNSIRCSKIRVLNYC